MSARRSPAAVPSSGDIAEAARDIIETLRSMGNASDRAGMARFGINVGKAFGIKVTALRALARTIGRSQDLAEALWESGWHEARMLATIIAEPKRLSRDTAERWVREFDSWDLCDGGCNNAFRLTPYAHELVTAWNDRDGEFVRRAGFAMIAVLATHDRISDDVVFLSYLPMIIAAADDDRNFVKKAVNWALREIGGRSPLLRREAEHTAQVLAARPEASARWIGKDALREFARKAIPPERPPHPTPRPSHPRARRT